VIALNYAPLFTGGFTAKAYKYFLIKRFARIYPLYVVASIVCALLVCIGLRAVNVPGILGWAILTNLTLVAAWGIGPYTIDDPAWSISTEYGAYLLFPFLVGLLLSGSKCRPMIAICIIFMTLHYMGSLPNSAFNQFDGRGGPLAITETTTIGPLVRCLTEFALGMIAYRATASLRIMRIASRPLLADVLGFLILVLLFGRTTDIPFVFLIAAFLVALTAETSTAVKVLCSVVPYELGIISYSLYLVHVPVAAVLKGLGLPEMLDQVSHSYSGLYFVVIAVAVSMLVSMATYRFIEKPGLRSVTEFLS
jgi:peptidoglycan/LPS O-acetylase OafA/YrhL